MDKRVWVVAGWEFKRYFKWKGEIFSLLLIVGLAAASFGGQGFIAGLMSDDPARIAVIGAKTFTSERQLRLADFPQDSAGPLQFEHHGPEGDSALQESVAAEELQGILYLASNPPRVLVFEDDSWIESLRHFLGQVQQNSRLQAHQLSSDQFAALLEPAALDVQYHPQGNPPTSKGERLFAVVVLALMLIGILTSFGYFFISITSEKQQRITEQIISAVSAQTWIDGKLIGISAMSIKSMLTAGLTAFFGIFLYSQFSDQPWLISGFTGHPLTLITMAFFGLAGLAFWNCFLAAIAATVNDPNTSTRTPLMLLPGLPMGIGFVGLSQPDSIGMQILSWFPVTSMGVMPMRLALGNVAVWEVALSLLLLVAAIAWLRLAAGRIFRVSMLIYGKEPSWQEMLRWLKET